ncbi:tRNA dimethylallyltransferase [Dissostichus eleginoides]|uniref:tRNA dimethylallyltransferase n=1 Tax=Dissostichus eleginoides TaxID=100907 RepID=A0AAD9CC76_DISEL|nr:tRNA dimethylallyltransferase [Dissostichus eleginoides]
MGGLGLWSGETIHLLRTCACFNASDKGEGGETKRCGSERQAFLDEMLVEAKKNLRAQGLDDNVQLAWRKQPDGQVFHKEEEKKRDEL